MQQTPLDSPTQHEVWGGLVEEAVGAFGVNDSDQFICEIIRMFP